MLWGHSLSYGTWILVMIDLTNVKITNPNPNYISISWQVKPTEEDLSEYTLDIYKSGAPTSEDGYKLLIEDLPLDTLQDYSDTTVKGLTNKFTNHYYLLRAIKNKYTSPDSYNEDAQNFGPYSISVKPDKFAREIIRKRDLVLNHHSGQTFLAYIRRTHGQFCTVCFDPTLQRVTKSNCTSCYGTGFAYGYYPPISFRAQLNEAPKRHQITVFGSWQDQDGILVMGEYPILTPRDFVVDVLGRRWKVVSPRTTNKSMFIINQNIQIRQIEKGDILYQIGE